MERTKRIGRPINPTWLSAFLDGHLLEAFPSLSLHQVLGFWKSSLSEGALALFSRPVLTLVMTVLSSSTLAERHVDSTVPHTCGSATISNTETQSTPWHLTPGHSDFEELKRPFLPRLAGLVFVVLGLGFCPPFFFLISHFYLCSFSSLSALLCISEPLQCLGVFIQRSFQTVLRNIVGSSDIFLQISWKAQIYHELLKFWSWNLLNWFSSRFFSPTCPFEVPSSRGKWLLEKFSFHLLKEVFSSHNHR